MFRNGNGEVVENLSSEKIIYYSLNLNQSKSTDYRWNLTDSNS